MEGRGEGWRGEVRDGGSGQRGMGYTVVDLLLDIEWGKVLCMPENRAFT